MTITAHLGDRDVELHVPREWHVTVAEPPAAPPLPDLDAAIEATLRRPLGSPRLRELAEAAVARAGGERRHATAVVVVTDSTRECPDNHFLPPVLRELEGAGIGRADIAVLVATGLHRASTTEEKRAMLGPEIVAGYRVLDHDALDPDSIVDLGVTSGGIPVTTNRIARDADLLVATGVVEPHHYAGYSGGAKTVAIGVAGEPTIAATHGIAMLDHAAVRLARLDGNPFHEAVTEIGRMVGLDFVVNVVSDAHGRPLAVAAGEPEAVHRHLAAVAADAFTVPVDRQADVAIAGVASSKAANLYQASRAVTYLHFAPIPAVRPGGVYLLPAAIPEGAGEGVGERRFLAAFRDAGDPLAVMDRLRRDGVRGGEQRAYLVAAVLGAAAIVVVGAKRPDVAEACGMRTALTLDEGLALAQTLARAGAGAEAGTPADATLTRAGRSRPIELLIVPQAITTLPIVTPTTLA